VAGATTGVVERDEILGPDRVVAGDVALALAASGLHSNGYSLVRKVFADAGWGFDRDVPEFGHTLGEELLTPTRVYARDLLAVIRAVEVHSISHITGGGLANNLVRVLPKGIRVDIDRASWTPPAVFDLVQRLGRVSQPDIEATLNQGVGMVVMLPQSSVAPAQELLTAAGIASWVAGSATASSDGTAQVELHGAHPAR
jgi:phosphoribosylformylglycinamidine cyclo-ligase